MIFGNGNGRKRNLVRRIKKTQPQARREQSLQGFVELAFGNDLLSNRFRQIEVLVPKRTRRIGSGLHGGGRSLDVGFRKVMASRDVIDRTAIRSHESIKLPVTSQRSVQQLRVRT